MRVIFTTCLVLTAAFFVFVQSYAQQPDKNNIDARIKRLIDDYNLYADFSEDGNKISNRYKEQFKALFAPNAKVYNDLPKTDTPEMVPVQDYIDEAVVRFSKGLSTRLRNRKTLRRGKPEFRTEIDSTYTISVDKDITAFDHKNKTTEKSQNTLFFVLGYSIQSDELKIIAISNSDKEARVFDELPGGSIVTKLLRSAPLTLSIGAMPGLSNIIANTKSIDNFYLEDLSKLKSGFGLGWGVNAQLLASVNKRFQLGIGAGIAQYKSNLTLAFVEADTTITDKDNLTATRHYTIKDFKETQKQMFIQAPVFGRFHLVSGNTFNLFLDGGLAFGFKLGSAKGTYEGTFTAYNQYTVPEKLGTDGYAEFTYTLTELNNSNADYDDAHNRKFGLYDDEPKFDDKIGTENNMELKDFNLMALAGLGASVALNKSVSLFGEMRCYFGILNLQASETNDNKDYINALDYKSLWRASKTIKTLSAGMEVGAIITLRTSKK